MNLSKSFSIILLFSILNIASICAYNRTILNHIGEFNTPYINAVGRGLELIYSFDLPDNFDPLHSKIRVVLKTDNATTTKFPLLASIIQTHDPASVSLPLNIRDSNANVVRYVETSRTLCIHAEHFDMDEQHFAIRISTSSVRIVSFELQVLKIDAMKIGLDTSVTITISPTTPDFYYFEFPKTKESEEIHVRVTVTSPYEKCTILSIQPALCPVPDNAEKVRVAGAQMADSSGWEWETLRALL